MKDFIETILLIMLIALVWAMINHNGLSVTIDGVKHSFAVEAK